MRCLEWSIGPLHDPVTWYQITHAGAQVVQWDFQNKGRSRWTGTSCIVSEVPLCNLRTSMCDFVPCDWIVQRAYYNLILFFFFFWNVSKVRILSKEVESEVLSHLDPSLDIFHEFPSDSFLLND